MAMKITGLAVRNVRWPVGGGGASTLGLVEIGTDAGIAGQSFLGTTWRGAQYDSPFLMEVIKPLLIGRDALQIGGIWNDLIGARREVSMRAIGAVDVALWDIAGKRAGLPVHQLLGSARSEVRRLRQHRRSCGAAGLRCRGDAIRRRRLAGLQDSPVTGARR